MRVLRTSFCVLILDLGVNAVFRLIIDPLTDKKLIFIMIKVGALALPQIVNPVAFKMIAVTLCKNAVAVSLCLVPQTFVNVFVCVNHAAFSLGHSVDPVPVVTVPVFVEESAAAMLPVLNPIASILTSQFFTFHAPVSALALAFV